MLGESSTHLRQPVALETQLLDIDHMDTEVGNSMLQLLQVLSIKNVQLLHTCICCYPSACPADCIGAWQHVLCYHHWLLKHQQQCSEGDLYLISMTA